MAQRIEAFSHTVPKNTAKASPNRQALTFPDGVVVQVEIVIPSGHIGQTGFRLDYGGQQVIPDTAGAFLTSNGEVIRWPLEDFPTGQQWQSVAYNTDKAYTHTFYYRFLINELVVPDNQPIVVAPVAIG